MHVLAVTHLALLEKCSSVTSENTHQRTTKTFLGKSLGVLEAGHISFLFLLSFFLSFFFEFQIKELVSK